MFKKAHMYVLIEYIEIASKNIDFYAYMYSKVTYLFTQRAALRT